MYTPNNHLIHYKGIGCHLSELPFKGTPQPERQTQITNFIPIEEKKQEIDISKIEATKSAIEFYNPTPKLKLNHTKEVYHFTTIKESERNNEIRQKQIKELRKSKNQREIKQGQLIREQQHRQLAWQRKFMDIGPI